MKRLLVLFCSLAFLLSHAQIPSSLDSLKVFLKTKPKDTTYVLALNDYVFLMVQEGNYAEANKRIAQMADLSAKLNFGNGFYKTMNNRGIVEYSKQNPEKAMEYFLKCNEIITKYKLPKKIYQNSLNNIGIIYSDMENRDKATEFAIKLIHFQEKNKLNPLKSWPYDQIASNLKFYKKHQEALHYYFKSLEIETQNKNDTGIAVCENNIGNVYDDLKKTKKAIQHYETGLKYAEKTNYKLLQTDFLTNLGRMCQKEEDYEKAEIFFKQSEKICLEIDLIKPLKPVYHGLGDLYFAKKNYPLSEKYYLKALAIAKTIEGPESMYSINQALADLKERTGDYKSAFQYKVNAEIFKDSTFEIETAKNTEDLLRKYETEKKEQEIAIKTIEIKNYNKQKWYFIFGILLLAIVIGSLIVIYRNKQKSSRILEQKNHEMNLLNEKLEIANTTKAKLFSIISHDLRSPISHIYQFLDLQKTEPELFSETDKQRHNDRISQAANTVLETMEDLLIWSKTQMQAFTVSKETIRLAECVNSIIELMQPQIDKKMSTVISEIPHDLILTSDRNILTILIRNILQNALKFSPEKSTVSIKTAVNDGSVSISISDEGNGIPVELRRIFENESAAVDSRQSGLGFTLIKEMAELLGAGISMTDNHPKGTIITVRILQHT